MSRLEACVWRFEGLEDEARDLGLERAATTKAIPGGRAKDAPAKEKEEEQEEETATRLSHV